MMATISKWTEGVEVRRHNGQNAYGEWMPIGDDDIPQWVEGLVGDEIAEEGGESGRVERGGSLWLWRKVAAETVSVYVVRDASGEYARDESGERRTPASDEAHEFATAEEAQAACTRATDRVLSREAE